ncbi:Predicted DNA-binding transcriptional regulator YafY, contains an HTH and WYL domains [Sporobacter termitidis DSM 10068]|uniref:Predicted DNA-binding transcriptional regulator YafY, contains an HTH and WYL domains n=1 Tax=Sporobacter termitidis DSM 10068 TaxID=1123282 RepID=A0A1M5YKM1_9FIRM|nr:WYL domain-containing protein [Sporobacter termitidis]SHI12595.1 Predicted DNA-binding transcriptional regulator YafY, contains an HTH and WYL domains [Sporobacter termitidis DSM 10068]
MPRSSNQKLKLLYLMKILQEKTDEHHAITVPELITELARYDISAERKSIYDDLEALKLFGLDIVSARGRTTGYYLASKDFELPELKLLVDSVQSSKFITHKKSMELIKKIESLCSVWEGQSLQRQVYVAGRVKTMNESIYYNVDKIHTGIVDNKKISFKYFEYSVTKEKVFRHGGVRYVASPYALTWDDENYYMIAYDSSAGQIKHYRVDKMTDIAMTEEGRDGSEHFQNLDIAVYSKKLFSMFSGEEETVRIEFENRLIGVVIDRFGRDVSAVPSDEAHFVVSVSVAVSPQFLAWVAGFGSEAKILSPESVVEKLTVLLRAALRQYGNPAAAATKQGA